MRKGKLDLTWRTGEEDPETLGGGVELTRLEAGISASMMPSERCNRLKPRVHDDTASGYGNTHTSLEASRCLPGAAWVCKRALGEGRVALEHQGQAWASRAPELRSQ